MNLVPRPARRVAVEGAMPLWIVPVFLSRAASACHGDVARAKP